MQTRAEVRDENPSVQARRRNLTEERLWRGGPQGGGGGVNSPQSRARPRRAAMARGGIQTLQQGNPLSERDNEPEGGSQREIRAQEPDGGGTERRAPPEQSHALNTSGRRGGGGGGGRPPQQRAPTVHIRGTGGEPQSHNHRTPPRPGSGQGGQREGPHPQQHTQPARGQEGVGTDRARPQRASQAWTKGGTPPNGSVRSQRTACPSRRGGGTLR